MAEKEATSADAKIKKWQLALAAATLLITCLTGGVMVELLQPSLSPAGIRLRDWLCRHGIAIVCPVAADSPEPDPSYAPRATDDEPEAPTEPDVMPDRATPTPWGTTPTPNDRVCVDNEIIDDCYYKVQSGDSLSSIARRFWGEPHRPGPICDANRDIIEEARNKLSETERSRFGGFCSYIPAGMIIYIPKREEEQTSSLTSRLLASLNGFSLPVLPALPPFKVGVRPNGNSVAL